jgi:hypothetical protein
MLLGWFLERMSVERFIAGRRGRLMSQEDSMRVIAIAFAALATLSFAAAANAETVVVKHKDNGYHRGWDRGHHYGWRNHHKKVVIIKRGHRDHD